MPSSINTDGRRTTDDHHLPHQRVTKMLNAKSLTPFYKRIVTALRALHPVQRLHPEREEGQALVLVALLIVALLLFVGLGVDIGHLMARRAKLQSAVDASALSAAQMLVSTAQTNPRIKAEQIMEANGIQLDSLTETLTVEEYPGLFQVRVAATQRVETFFMRLLPGLETANISAEATADLSTYAEINAKPYGQPGVVNELNLMVWGRESHRRHGDAYSPEYNSMAGSGVQNPQYADMPYGYLYRIDVPDNFPGDTIVIEAFDPDTWNRDGAPPAWDTALANNANRDPWQFASCGNPSPERCTSGGVRENTAVHLEAFPDEKPAFWRVDEFRYKHDGSASGGAHEQTYSTHTFFEVWHFDPYITTVFANPHDLTDSNPPRAIDTFDIRYDSSTDLRWVQILRIENFRNYAREDNGKWYFYVYVQGQDGSSENNYDLRVGPPQPLDCQNYTDIHCDVNRLYRDFNYNSAYPLDNNRPFQEFLRANGYCAERPSDGNSICENIAQEPLTLWKDGGAQLFAKRALPLNLITGDRFPVHLTQIPRQAAGQTLGIRHFDMDCTNNNVCGQTMNYQMQICGCTNTNSDACWQNVGTGHIGDNNRWTYGTAPDPELVEIPSEDDADFSTFFGSGTNTCQSSLLRMQSYPSFSEDTSVWEIPFIRPRLIR
jgi:hypothetical protein